MKKRLSADALAYFREQGARGGKIGGKRAAALLSPAERKARASKGGQATARAKKHAKKA